MNSQKILLVEDERPMQLIVQAALNQKCNLICVSTLAEAKEALGAGGFALILLDVMLPDGDGFEFCEDLRRDPRFASIPIIFLTAETRVDRKVFGFSLGADDYITKPIEPTEFTARVSAKLKRQKLSQTSLTHAGLRVDLNLQKAFIRSQNSEKEVGLTPIEFKLLAHFMKNEGHILAREELMTAVWGRGVHVSAHTLDTHISSLRKKLVDYGSAIKAVVRKGYCFTPISVSDQKTA